MPTTTQLPKIIDTCLDPVPNTNLQFGWDGERVYYRQISNKKDVAWKPIKLLLIYPSRIWAISNMMVRAGYDA